MTVVITFGSIMLVTFLAAFFAGRRFGVMALSLAVGSLLSSWWGGWLAGLLNNFDIAVPGIPSTILATLILLLLPLVATLISGPKYGKKHKKIISAAAISVLMIALLIVPLGGFIKMDNSSLVVYRMLVGVWRYLATAGFVAGVIDLLLMHNKVAKHLSNKH